MAKLINIDNGGTLTDICAVDGDRVYRTKTLTTPHDLSRCLLDGLAKVSKVIYGKEDLAALLLSTSHIRYSTTQGTNSLVERKGPRLGIIVGGTMTAAALRKASRDQDLFDKLVGDRVAVVDASVDNSDLELTTVRATNALTSAGANRIVVAFGGADCRACEERLKSILLRKFPQHLLGAVPILYSHEIVEDDDDVRRAWTALFNAFLHPPMERFLYHTEHKLRAARAQNPLLIFRNDGQSARVAKTTALKTYSSGPRGGMEGARALAQHYGFGHLLSMDVGGTTTDIGEVTKGEVREHRFGQIEGVQVSMPLCDVTSVGIGGSSIISVVDGRIKVGPQSVGSAPGPACFGLGGELATITDAFVISGLLDPASYFGGELKLDLGRAKAAVEENVARPLGLTVDAAVAAMETAWVQKIAVSLQEFARITPDTTLAAFGGAGPLVVCRVAEAAGISRVLIPGLAAVFSAFGIGFSDIGHTYEAHLHAPDQQALATALDELLESARRGIYAEGFELEQCLVEKALRFVHEGQETRIVLAEGTAPDLSKTQDVLVEVRAVKPLPHPALKGDFTSRNAEAKAAGKRLVRDRGKAAELPLYRIENLSRGTAASGPAVLEEAFFTCRIDAGWSFTLNSGGDLLLTRAK